MNLRAATPLDAGRVGAILSGFIDETDWMPRLHSRAENIGFAGQMIDRGWVTVAETNGALGAFMARNGSEVNALYVDAPHRRCGIGSALLHAAQAAQDRLELWTFQANTGAQAFYAAHGFAEAERTNGAGNDEGLPDIRLIWRREA